MVARLLGYLTLTLTMLYPACSPSRLMPYRKRLLIDVDIQYDPLVQPALLRDEIRASPQSHATIAAARFTAARIIAGQEDRLLVIVGPCSIHSAKQALDYARLLKEKLPTWPNLHIIMRSYLYVLTSWFPFFAYKYFPVAKYVCRMKPAKDVVHRFTETKNNGRMERTNQRSRH